MTDFTVHTIESAPEESKSLLEDSTKSFGMLPNLHAVMAESPQVLDSYKHLSTSFTQTSLSADEQHVVWLSINVENECRYCVPAHSVIAKMHGIDAEIVEALRDARPLKDEKLEALRAFTLKIIRQRGNVSDGDVEIFLSAGFSKRQVLEVVLGVAHKTMSNYINHIASTPTDPAFENEAWTPPAG